MSETSTDIASLMAALAAAEARASGLEADLQAPRVALNQAQAVASAADEMIKNLRLQIAKLRRDQYGHSAERRAPSAERQARLIE